VAFVLHFGWEAIQCPIFFVHRGYVAGWGGMALASLGDVALTWVLHAVVAGVSRRWRWTRGPWSWGQWAWLLGGALGVAVGIERVALARDLWSYRAAMPVIPGLGVGVVPVLQLLVLTPLTFALAERLVPRSGDPDATDETRRRYDRIAPMYDALEWLLEFRFRGWRRELWAGVRGERLLELGIGTGKNLPFHPAGADVTGVDISEGMLRIARKRAAAEGCPVDLVRADVQELPFDDASFDVVVATFLFCSVPEPVCGLREAMRVLRPGGRIVLLEHVLSEKRGLRTLMRWLDPLPAHLWGAHIDRPTAQHVEAAGFERIQIDNRLLDVVQLIDARAPSRRTDDER
jgi:SAM-dependent methyltransferase